MRTFSSTDGALATPEFMSGILPDLITSADTAGKKLHVVLSNFNDVPFFPQGNVPTQKNSIRVTLLKGSRGTDFVPFARHLLTYIDPSQKQAVNTADVDDEHELEERLSKLEISSADDTVFVIYAGNTVFKECAKFIERLRELVPQARIAVLTCDCTFLDKHAIFDPLVNQEVIDWLLVTERCGGVWDMCELITFLSKYY
jgi:hypothetical protein